VGLVKEDLKSVEAEPQHIDGHKYNAGRINVDVRGLNTLRLDQERQIILQQKHNQRIPIAPGWIHIKSMTTKKMNRDDSLVHREPVSRLQKMVDAPLGNIQILHSRQPSNCACPQKLNYSGT
jgi:hypothetical protein